MKQMEVYHYTGEAPAAGGEDALKRVAAYCRVSTLAEEQELSFATQCDHYRQLIEGDPQMALVGIYGDQGVTGLSAEKRPEFQRLIRDCMTGKIDLVITKSISRFARNLSDCLKHIELLREKGIPVLFEREGFTSMDPSCEMILSILASIAQEEINSISQSICWAHERRNASGDPARRACYGYRKAPKRPGQKRPWLIFEPEAKRIRLSFESAKQGRSYREILDALNALEREEQSGYVWQKRRLFDMLQNEAYIGDILTNKTFTPDYVAGKSVKNKGQRPQFYIEGHHEAIIDRQTFDLVGRLIRSRTLR